jgi:hypothetical protein
VTIDTSTLMPECTYSAVPRSSRTRVGVTSVGVGGIVDYHGFNSDWICQDRGLVDDCGVGVDASSSGVGGLVYDRCVGGELISHGDGDRVDNRGVDYNLISRGVGINLLVPTSPRATRKRKAVSISDGGVPCLFTSDDIKGGVHCGSPTDYICYLDGDHTDEGMGVFRLLGPKMQIRTFELWIFSETSGMTRMATSTSKGEVLQDLVDDEVGQDLSELEDQFIDASKGGVLQDLVVEEVGQDFSELKDEFVDASEEGVLQDLVIDEVEQNLSELSGSNEVIVLTPPNFNKNAYANKLALCPHHECVHQSPESIKAIEARDLIFQDVVDSRNITHLQGLPTIRHQAPREKSDDLVLRNGSTQNDFY